MDKYLQNYQGPPAKKPKTDEEIKNRKLDYDKNTRVREFQPQWLKSFEWLEYHVVNGEGKMFCKICRKYESIGTFVSGSKTFKLESIKAHNSSNSHTKNNLKFQAKTKKPGTSEAEKALLTMNKAVHSQMTILFKNGHALAKAGRPFTDFTWLCDLDEAKGLNIGHIDFVV